jgi:hypothetical protein
VSEPFAVEGAIIAAGRRDADRRTVLLALSSRSVSLTLDGNAFQQRSCDVFPLGAGWGHSGEEAVDVGGEVRVALGDEDVAGGAPAPFVVHFADYFAGRSPLSFASRTGGPASRDRAGHCNAVARARRRI